MKPTLYTPRPEKIYGPSAVLTLLFYAAVICAAACAPLIQTGGSVSQVDRTPIASAANLPPRTAEDAAGRGLPAAPHNSRREMYAATGTANVAAAEQGATVSPRSSSTISVPNNFWRWVGLALGAVALGWLVWKFVFTGARIALIGK